MAFIIGRRQLIGGLGLLAATPLAAQTARTPRMPAHPFTLGVASGDPDAGGFVIWTRLAPLPDQPHAGLDPMPYPLRWQVAEDESFGRVVAEGETLARPELGWSAHVEVAGLQPARPYHYRFMAGSEVSATGRARTLPAAGADVREVRLAVAGCQDYQGGYYTAWKHLATEAPDTVFHYGDYIYEYGAAESFFNFSTGQRDSVVRQHNSPMTFSLDDYRRRYTQIRLDADLQAAHQAAPFLCSFDDHEVVNNWVGDVDQHHTPPELFRLRRAAAMQAWYEFMPVRADAFPVNGLSGPWRQYRFGRLLDARLLNTRNHRTDQPCNDKFGTICDGVNAPEAQVLGRAQEDWLVDGLTAQPARWNALLQQIMMMDMDRARDGETGINTDSWAAYQVPRDRLLHRLAPVPNLIVLTGDEHQHFAGEVRPANAAPETPASAIEFVTTSVSSGSDGPGERAEHAEVLRRNPHVRYIRDERGYSLMTITPDQWRTDHRTINTIRTPGGTLSTHRSFVVPNGRAALEAA